MPANMLNLPAYTVNKIEEKASHFPTGRIRQE